MNSKEHFEILVIFSVFFDEWHLIGIKDASKSAGDFFWKLVNQFID